MRLSLVITILFAAAVCCTPVCAEPISLADLIANDGSITVGDKLFDEFSYLATGDMPPAEGVNIAPYTDVDGNFGIVIQGGFVDLFGSPGASDALISFQVTALDPNKLISDAHLFGNPFAYGDAIMQVVETFGSAEPTTALSITNVSPSPNPPQLADAAYFDTPHRSLLVQKDILALAQTPGSAASISFVYQTFSQVEVPEPTCVAFLLSGLALLCCRVRCFDR